MIMVSSTASGRRR